MTILESVQTCFSNYVSWKGRASRSEFWYFVLFYMSSAIVALIIDVTLGTSYTYLNPSTETTSSLYYGYIYTLTALILFLPYLSVTVRRLHDKDRSGWYYWILLIPIVGFILFIVSLASRGTAGDNKYGSDPLS